MIGESAPCPSLLGGYEESDVCDGIACNPPDPFGSNDTNTVFSTARIVTPLFFVGSTM
jgi:hypothetical protein